MVIESTYRSHSHWIKEAVMNNISEKIGKFAGSLVVLSVAAAISAVVIALAAKVIFWLV